MTGTGEKDKEMSLVPVILAEDQELQICIFYLLIPVLAAPWAACGWGDLGTNCVPISTASFICLKFRILMPR